MPVNYLAGTMTGGIYSGVNVNDSNSLLTTMGNALSTSGQTVEDEISSNNRIITTGLDAGDACTKIYSTENVSGVEYKLKIQGDNTANGGILMPTILEIPFIANGNALLYLTSDEAAECLTIINPGAESKAIHAGWLDRRNVADKGSWMIGYLDVWMTNAFVAQDIHSQDWREVKTFYYSSAESFTNPKGPYQHLWDSGCAALVGTVGSNTSSTTFNFKPWLGQADSVTGMPTLLPYGYLQGASAYNEYTNIDPDRGQGLHNPGWVRFARNGMAFMDAGDQCREGTKTFISGGATGTEAYQGFQISA